MDKNPRDEINKAAWLMIEAAKDAAQANVMQSVISGKVKLEADQLQLLLSVITASIEEGYSRANRAFSRVVDEALSKKV
jgi:hypothetical protein